MTPLQAFLHSHIFQVTALSTLTGAGGALRADWQAFSDMKTPEQFIAYNWRLAAFRAFHGAIIGFATGLSGSGILRSAGWM